MRKFIVFIFILCGAAVGVLATQHETTGLSIVLGCIGAVVGTAFGGAITGIGKSRRRSDVSEADGFTEMHEERSRNFWLDGGRLSDAPGLPHLDDNDSHSLEP